MSISPENESAGGSTSAAQVTVPDVTAYEYNTAVQTLKGAGLNVAIADGDAGNGKWLVQDQYPKAGMTVGKGTTIYLYRE